MRKKLTVPTELITEIKEVQHTLLNLKGEKPIDLFRLPAERFIRESLKLLDPGKDKEPGTAEEYYECLPSDITPEQADSVHLHDQRYILAQSVVGNHECVLGNFVPEVRTSVYVTSSSGRGVSSSMTPALPELGDRTPEIAHVARAIYMGENNE